MDPGVISSSVINPSDLVGFFSVLITEPKFFLANYMTNY